MALRCHKCPGVGPCQVQPVAPELRHRVSLSVVPPVVHLGSWISGFRVSEKRKGLDLTPIPLSQRLCRNKRDGVPVIPNEVKNLISSSISIV